MAEEKQEITEQFIEDMVERVINRLSEKLDELDISLDYIGAILSGQSSFGVAARQKGLGRLATDKAVNPSPKAEV
mgnify:CR=1 FL=1